MKTYRCLTLSAAIVITVLEAWLFAGASAAPASQTRAQTVAVMVTETSGGAP